MEVLNASQDVQNPNSRINKDFVQVTSNWKSKNNKPISDMITIGSTTEYPEGVDMNDVVSLETCINMEQQENNSGPCTIDIKLTNGQRISHIALYSGAYILEIFKQYGEYETTVTATVLDDFNCEAICFMQTSIKPLSTEASIKFTKLVRNDASLWIYGIKLYLTDPIKVQGNDIGAGLFNPEIIKSFLSKCGITEKHDQAQKEVPNNGSIDSNMNITSYIDNKLLTMETRLMQRINAMEERVNQKLDAILQQVQITNTRRTDCKDENV